MSARTANDDERGQLRPRIKVQKKKHLTIQRMTMKTRFIVDFDENENTKMGAVVLFGVLGVSGRLIEEFFPFFSVLCVYFLLRNVSDIEWILSSSYENVYESE